MPDKISKAAARYQDKPKVTKRCAGCSMFRSPNRCTLVSGDILPNGYCRYWEAKKD